MSYLMAKRFLRSGLESGIRLRRAARGNDSKNEVTSLTEVVLEINLSLGKL